MNPTSNPPFDPRLLEETRRQINRLIEEVARLSETELPPTEYYGELLKRILAAMAAPAGAVWTRTAQGNLQVAFHVNLREVGLDRDEQTRRTHDELLREAVTDPKPRHLLPHSGMGGETGKAGAGNPTDFLLLLVPIILNNEVKGLIEVWQSPERPLNAVPGFLQFMQTMADLAARYMRNQMMGQMVGQQQVWTQLEAFTRQIHATLNPVEVSYHVANEGRRLIECDRVSVGIREGASKVKVHAVSGADIVETRSNLVRLMRKLMEKVVAWGEKLVYSGTRDETLPPDVATALDAYLAESNSKLLVVLPLKDERDKDTKRLARSVLIMECFDPPAEPQQIVSRLEVIGRHACSAIYNAAEHRRIPMRFLWMPLARVQEGLGGKAKATLIVLLLLLVALGSALWLVPYPLKMDARGQLLPQTRVWVYPHETGTVVSISVNPGDEVPENYELLQMYSSSLHLKLDTLEKEKIGASNQIALLEGERKLRQNRQARVDANLLLQLADAQAREGLKQSELDNLRKALGATDLKPGYFPVRSPKFTDRENARRRDYRLANGLPVDAPPLWTVLNSDFRENLTNRSVEPSVPLIRLGDRDGGWEIELKIPQQHIGQVLRAYSRLNVQVLDVDLLVRSEPTRIYKGKLYRQKIGGEANPQRDENNEAEPVVIAYVSIDDEAIAPEDRLPRRLLVTGTEVRAKIRCGNHRMGYSLFYGVWEFFYEKILFWF